MDCGLGCGDSYVDTSPVLSRPGAAGSSVQPCVGWGFGGGGDGRGRGIVQQNRYYSKYSCMMIVPPHPHVVGSACC